MEEKLIRFGLGTPGPGTPGTPRAMLPDGPYVHSNTCTHDVKDWNGVRYRNCNHFKANCSLAALPMELVHDNPLT